MLQVISDRLTRMLFRGFARLNVREHGMRE
jgi:hypothetical protein